MVAKAYHKTTNEVVIIKFFKHISGRLLQAIPIDKNINHEGLIKIQEFSYQKEIDQFYIIQEWYL